MTTPAQIEALIREESLKRARKELKAAARSLELEVRTAKSDLVKLAILGCARRLEEKADELK